LEIGWRTHSFINRITFNVDTYYYYNNKFILKFIEKYFLISENHKFLTDISLLANQLLPKSNVKAYAKITPNLLSLHDLLDLVTSFCYIYPKCYLINDYNNTFKKMLP